MKYRSTFGRHPIPVVRSSDSPFLSKSLLDGDVELPVQLPPLQRSLGDEIASGDEREPVAGGEVLGAAVDEEDVRGAVHHAPGDADWVEDVADAADGACWGGWERGGVLRMLGNRLVRGSVAIITPSKRVIN